MKRHFAVVTLLAAGCLGAGPEPIPALADRILKLAEQEPIESGIDTRLRAAQLLMPVEPDLGKKFLSSGMALLRAHPEVPRGRTITSCIVALDVPGGDKVLLAGNDRVLAYNQLLWHWASRGQERRAAAALRMALRDTAVTEHLDELWGAGRVLQPLSGSDPKEAAALLVDFARVSGSQKSPANLIELLGTMLWSFVRASPSKAAEVAGGLRLLLPLVSDPEFPSASSAVPAVKRELGGQMVETRNAHESLLFRFGASLHVLAPDVYEESHALFQPWDAALRSINTREKLVAIGGRPPQTGGGGASLDINRAPFAEALAAVEKMPKEKISAYGNIALRSDITPEQRAEVVERARKLIRSQLSAGVEKADKDSVTYHSIARNMRWTGIELDSDDPSLKAKQALIDLEEAVQPRFDFTLPGPDGKIRRLSDDRGKVVLVNFWATWCPPCRAEMPLLAKLNREWGPKGLSIMAISDETPAEVTSYEGQFHYNLPVLLDPSRKVFDHYRVQGIPDTRIIDRSGRIVASFGELLSEEEIVRVLRAAGLE